MEESNNLLDQILSHGPSQSTLYLVLKKMKEKRLPNEVIQECLKVLNIYPDDIRLMSLLAESYLEVGFIGQAEAEMDKVISRVNDLISAFNLQARIYIKQHRFKDASEALKKYLTHKPEDQDALGLLDRIKQIEEGAEVIEDVSAEIVTPTLAELYYSQGQIQEAISTYKKILSKNPEDKASMHRLIELQALTGKEAKQQISDNDKVKAKKKKMITILQTWLNKIQELNNVS